MGFQFREGHFDGIEVRAVRRQEQHPCSLGSHDALCLEAFVAGQIVENDDIARVQAGRKLGFDVSIKDRPVHRCIYDPGGNKAVAPQACHEGLRPPSAKGCGTVQPRPLQRPPAQAGHLGIG